MSLVAPGSILEKLNEVDINTSSTLSVIPKVNNSGFLNVTTTGTAGTYATFGSQACASLLISNTSDEILWVKKNATGAAFYIPLDTCYPIYGLTNANQISVARSSTATAIVISANWES